MRFSDPRATKRPVKTDHAGYSKERDSAAMAVVTASAELRLHGIPRDREARKRLESVLGDIRPHKADDGEAGGRYDPLRFRSGHDPLRYGK